MADEIWPVERAIGLFLNVHVLVSSHPVAVCLNMYMHAHSHMCVPPVNVLTNSIIYSICGLHYSSMWASSRENLSSGFPTK